MAKSIRRMESLIERGEGAGAGGFVAQTANGTARWKGTGWNENGPGPTSPELPASPTRPGGRSDRTGE